MSNRDGKTKRRPFRIGVLCPNCKKEKLIGCDQSSKEGHAHHAFCPTCKKCNF
jgi:hypothetical protein